MEKLLREQERMQRRHIREKRELEERILNMKDEVPKNDKKKRKQVRQEAARLEAELELKQKEELEAFEELLRKTKSLESLTEELAKMTLETQQPHSSMTHKKRERKGAQEQQKMATAKPETPYLAGLRRAEEEKLGLILEAKNLEMKSIPADSHCMYRAIQDQVPFSVTVESLRRQTAKYLLSHIDDFLPFFSDLVTGSSYSQEDFLTYCDHIVHEASWGSQIELRALSHILQSPIEIVQMESPILVIGQEYTKKPLTLVYVRYASTFGEHYNSVKPLEAGAAGGAPA